MNKSIIKKIALGGVIISVILTGCSQMEWQSSNNEIDKKTTEVEIVQDLDFRYTLITRGQVADLLLNAASEYNKDLERKTIIKGYEDDEGKGATRVESLVMISSAFNSLPEPKGSNKDIIDKDAKFTDVPKWAQKDIDNLINGGVLSRPDNQKLNGDYPMTLEEIETIVRRIWAFQGTSLKDDFYNTINKNKLEAVPTAKVGETVDLVSLIEAKNKEEVNSIIKEIVNRNHHMTSKEQKIKNMYLNITNMEYRNNQGNKPIQKYLDGIDNSKELEDLNKLQRTMIKELGDGGPLNPVLIKDFRDDNTYMLSISSPMVTRGKEFYKDTNNQEIKAYKKYLTKLLILSGETKETAEKNVKAYLSLEEEMANNSLSNDELENSNNGSVIIKTQDLEKMIPKVEISKLITTAGYKLPKEIMINEENVFESYGKYLNDKNIELLKTVTKITLLQKNCVYLSREYLDAYNEYTKTSGEDKNLEEIGLEAVANSLQEYVGEIFVGKYFSKESKRDIEKMVKSIVKVYKERINGLDWMSKAAKKVAIKKLDKMKLTVGYSPSWNSPINKAEIRGKEDGGSYLENAAAVECAALKESVSKLGKKEENQKMKIPAFEANPYYNPKSNTMVFPAGMLSFPLYNRNRKPEENLGGIGTVIAHEISHIFYNNGAKYDENGGERNWWEESDYKKFQNLCRGVEHFYNGFESAPGITSDEKQTLGENISDIAGVACTLEIMSKMKSPDYNAFFSSYGKKWAVATTREDLEFLSIQGEHSTANIRVNRVLGNFEEFYKTYNIKKGDGMYIDPKDRIKIW